MVLKLITHAEDRLSNIHRSLSALDALVLEGDLKTNVTFHRLTLHNKAFQEGHLHTGFIREQRIMEKLDEDAKAHASLKRRRAAAVAAALTRAPGGGIRGVHYRQTAPKPLAGQAQPPAWAMRGRRV